MRHFLGFLLSMIAVVGFFRMSAVRELIPLDTSGEATDLFDLQGPMDHTQIQQVQQSGQFSPSAQDGQLQDFFRHANRPVQSNRLEEMTP